MSPTHPTTIIEGALARHRQVLTELASMLIIKAAGLPVIETVLARTREEAVAAAFDQILAAPRREAAAGLRALRSGAGSRN